VAFPNKTAKLAVSIHSAAQRDPFATTRSMESLDPQPGLTPQRSSHSRIPRFAIDAIDASLLTSGICRLLHRIAGGEYFEREKEGKKRRGKFAFIARTREIDAALAFDRTLMASGKPSEQRRCVHARTRSWIKFDRALIGTSSDYCLLLPRFVERSK